MNDDSMKVLYDLIQRELHNRDVFFQLGAVKFDEGYLAVRFIQCDAARVKDLIDDLLDTHAKNIAWSVDKVSVGTVEVKVSAVETIAQGIPFSSPDEARGTEPIEIAQLFVRQEIEKFDHQDEYKDFTTYVVWFAFILGGWKALVSTSVADGRYYEVTYNKEADEFYVDTYIKVQNAKYTSNED